MENKLQEINKEKITQEQREYERHESLVSMCDADEHRRYPSGMLIEDDCHVCGNVHPYIGECRGSFADPVVYTEGVLVDASNKLIENEMYLASCTSKVMADKHAAYIGIETTDWADPELRKELDEDIFTGMSNEAMEDSLKEMNKINPLEVSNDPVLETLKLEDGKCYVDGADIVVKVFHLHPDSDYPFEGEKNLNRYMTDGRYIDGDPDLPIAVLNLVREATEEEVELYHLPSVLDEISQDEIVAFNEKESQKEAIRRFLNGEEPSFSETIVGSQAVVRQGYDRYASKMTAGYGHCDGNGIFEYPLPEPVSQWLKKKDFDLKVKINGMKYKARIIAFDSDEIIKRNFVQYCTDPAFGFGKRSIEVLKASYDRCIEKLKETRDASLFLETMTAGDSVKEHNRRVYLEIVDETYPAAGSISTDL